MKKYIKEQVRIPTDEEDLKLVILKPTAAKKPREETPGILWIHGGGYVSTTRKIASSRAADFVKKYGAVVVAPELLPGTPSRIARHGSSIWQMWSESLPYMLCLHDK